MSQERTSLEQQIKQWVISADKYHYLLESEEEYIAKEITKICTDFAKEAYTAGKERGMYEQECLEIGQLTGYDPSIPTFEEWLKK